MYRSGLVPPRAAWLGLIGGPLIIASGTAMMFGGNQPSSTLRSLRASRRSRSSCGSCSSASTAPSGFRPSSPILQAGRRGSRGGQARLTELVSGGGPRPHREPSARADDRAGVPPLSRPAQARAGAGCRITEFAVSGCCSVFRAREQQQDCGIRSEPSTNDTSPALAWLLPCLIATAGRSSRSHRERWRVGVDTCSGPGVDA